MNFYIQVENNEHCLVMHDWRNIKNFMSFESILVILSDKSMYSRAHNLIIIIIIPLFQGSVLSGALRQ